MIVPPNTQASGSGPSSATSVPEPISSEPAMPNQPPAIGVSWHLWTIVGKIENSRGFFAAGQNN